MHNSPAYDAAYGEGTSFVNAPDLQDESNKTPMQQQQVGGFQDYIPNMKDLISIKEELEGPKPLRVIAGLGGLALALGSGIGLINVVSLLTHPCQFVLRIYETLFGLLIAIVELKTFFQHGNKLKELCYKWFPFLTILGGKGAFYIFAGAMGIGFGWLHILVFVPAVFCLGMGVVYVLFHFGKCTELRDKYDQTVLLNSGTINPYAATPQR